VIVATATGGLGNYVYSLYNGQVLILLLLQLTPVVSTELVAGFYNVFRVEVLYRLRLHLGIPEPAAALTRLFHYGYQYL
jgi:hypothetical protein